MSGTPINSVRLRPLVRLNSRLGIFTTSQVDSAILTKKNSLSNNVVVIQINRKGGKKGNCYRQFEGHD